MIFISHNYIHYYKSRFKSMVNLKTRWDQIGFTLEFYVHIRIKKKKENTLIKHNQVNSPSNVLLVLNDIVYVYK